MATDLEHWLQTVTTAENLVKVRKNGMCYLEPSRFSVAETMMSSVGINLMEWLEAYFDYDHYN